MYIYMWLYNITVHYINITLLYVVLCCIKYYVYIYLNYIYINYIYINYIYINYIYIYSDQVSLLKLDGWFWSRSTSKSWYCHTCS